MNEAFTQSALKFLIRRGLTMAGISAMEVDDQWITKTVSIVLILGNEVYQWWQSHKNEQHKAAGTFTPEDKVGG